MEVEMTLDNKQTGSHGLAEVVRESSMWPQNLFETGFLKGGTTLPLAIHPLSEELDLGTWAETNRQLIEDELLKYGALLFRGFKVGSVEDFERFAESVCPDLYGEYQDLPKERGGKKTYKSTPYPADKTILFHNESSHMHRWPLRQFFCCLLPAREGGETPIVDGREIYRRLDREVVKEFEAKKLLYVRNFMDGFDVDWREFFQTDDPVEVESYCSKAGMEFEWRDSGLQTRQAAPAVTRHALTGEPVFFNQIQLHHRASLDSDLREALEAVLGENNLPRNVFYGDGTPIPDELVQEIINLYWQCSVAFPWQVNDVLMLDNMLCSHARNPFSGSRKIVVAMGRIVQGREVV
jgi:hypothetical protein